MLYDLENLSQKSKEGLKGLATALGIKALDSISSFLEPEKLIEEASRIMSDEIKEAVTSFLANADSSLIDQLVTKIYEDIEVDTIMQTISEPLVISIMEWLKEDSTDLIDAIVEELDMDALTTELANRLSGRVSLTD